MDTSSEWNKTYITAAGSTTPFTGRGTLGSIIIATTTTDTLTVRDGAQYTTIMVIPSGTTAEQFDFNCQIDGNLYISSTTTPVNCLVTWKI